MNDKELLWLAAKAAWLPLKPDFKERFDYYMEDRLMWNPLTDDGDALRLAVKLGLDMELHGMLHTFPYGQVTSLEHGLDSPDCEFEVTDSDPYAATRRAIVRAAAEIGRTK